MKNLIWWSCRIFAFLMVAGGFGYFLANTDSFDSIDQDVSDAEREMEKLTLAIEMDKNDSMSKVANLLRARSSIRQQEEELKDNSVGDREEMDALERKFSQTNEELVLVEDELEKKNESLEELLKAIETEEERQSPFLARVEELNQRLNEKLEQLKEKANEFDQLNVEMQKHLLIRRTAAENYESSFEAMSEGIVLPQSLFLGDELEASVESVSPSGHGFFIKKGQKDGLRGGFCFFIRPVDSSEENPFFAEVALAEDGYAFLEAENNSINLNDLLSIGEKLYLIRSGESDSSFDLDLPMDPVSGEEPF